MILDESESLRTAIYIRVSTEDQAKDGFSLDSQLKRLRDYCSSRKWNISGEYVDDGYSGRNVKRPKYQEMMANMDQWDIIVCIRGDRVHRNIKNFIFMQDLLNKNNKGYVSVTESYDTSTPVGRLLMTLLAGVAQYESEIIGERVSDGMEEKAQDLDAGGILNCIPFGYNYDKDTEIISENLEELKFVKKIFKLYDEDYNLREIAEKLGIHPRTGKPWHKSSIAYILHNPFYNGISRFKHFFKSIVEPCIDREVYNRVQVKMSKRTRGPKNKPLELPEDKKIFSIPIKESRELNAMLKNSYKSGE